MRLFFSRDSRTTRRATRATYRARLRYYRDADVFFPDAESSETRRGSRPASRAPVAPRPRHREDDDEHAGAGDDERRRRAGGGRFRFFLPTRPGCFFVRARRAFVVRRGHRRPVPRRVRVLEGDNARRKRGGGRQPGQGRPGRSRSRLENGARCRRRERRVRVSRTTHGVGPLAERLVHAEAAGGAASAATTPSHAVTSPARMAGVTSSGGTGARASATREAQSSVWPETKARSSTNSAGNPADFGVPRRAFRRRGRGRGAEPGATRRREPLAAIADARGRAGSCDALGARRASRGEKESA